MSEKDSLFPFDAKATDAILRAETDADAAVEVLRIAADYLRRREALPPQLADYIASAFEMAALKPNGKERNRPSSEFRLRALAEGLNLRIGNRRRAPVNSHEVLEFVDDLANGPTERQRVLKAAKHFDVSEGTIRNNMKEERHYRSLKPYS